MIGAITILVKRSNLKT